MDVTRSKQAPRRPRWLTVIAVLGFFYASIGCITAWSTLIALSGSHEQFSNAVREDASRMVNVPKELGTPDQLKAVAERKAEALWSRRGVFIPLAVANAVVCSLMLLAIAAAVSRRLAWGRSAWQFASLVSLACVGMEAVVNFVHSRDLVAAVADLHDTLSDYFRQLLPMRDAMLGAQTAIEVMFLVGSAAYLASEAAKRYCDQK